MDSFLLLLFSSHLRRYSVLFKTIDVAFVPGETVSGIIKYVVDKDILINRIMVSLKGTGYLKVTDRRRKRKNQRFAFRNSEEYVNIDCNILQGDPKGTVLSPGQYESNFNFKLPTDIPPSFTYIDSYSPYFIRCYILYYVRIKFERPGIFKFNKHFRKEFPVVSGLRPRLPINPTVYGEQKTLFKPFASKANIVDIKVNIDSCVIAPGGKIKLKYEVLNDTNVTIKSVKTLLEEVHTFKPLSHSKVKVAMGVPYTDTKTNPIKSGKTQNVSIMINIPRLKHSIENSMIVSRDYYVKILVELPSPHFDAIMAIPVQIGQVNCAVPEYSDPPPTYWEAMGEHNEMRDDD